MAISKPIPLYERTQLYRLIIARDCMNSVAEAVQTALSLKVDTNHDLFNTLHDSIVTSYGRAFVEMDPFGRISSKYEKFDDEEMLLTHNMLIERRHKHVAHTDYIPNRIVFYPPDRKRPDGSASPKLQYEVLKNYFSHHAYQSILKLAGRQTGKMMVDIEERIKRIYGEKGEKVIDVTELITSDDIKQLKNQKKKV
jgi:hypothetical protein